MRSCAFVVVGKTNLGVILNLTDLDLFRDGVAVNIVSTKHQGVLWGENCMDPT